MQITIVLSSVLALAAMSSAAPVMSKRTVAAQLCFIVGNVTLPAETQTAVDQLPSFLTCNTDLQTLRGVPDVIAPTVKFSEIDFSKSKLEPLSFALEKFATPADLTDSCLTSFQDDLDVYLATEAAQRSLGVTDLAIKAPKFFLAFQIARIKTAFNMTITDPGQTVEHLLGKVIKNAGRVNSTVIAQVQKLATELA